MNVALIGMPGTMKTSIGKELARRMGLSFVDSDEIFVKEEGVSIAEAFSEKGEEYFRTKETEIIKRLCNGDNQLISCGGGTPLRKENVLALKSSCIVVLLTASPQKIYERTNSDSKRPLLSGKGLDGIIALQEQRKQAYENAKDLSVDTTNLLPKKASAIIEKMLKRYDI